MRQNKFFFIAFLICSVTVLFNFILVELGLIDHVHKLGSGFNDDRLYVSKIEVQFLLKEADKLNRLFFLWARFLNYNPLLIKFFNALLYSFTIYEASKILKHYKLKFSITPFLLLAPCLIVIHKEFLLLTFVTIFLRLNITTKPYIKNLVFELLLVGLIFMLRYWMAFPLLLLLYLRLLKSSYKYAGYLLIIIIILLGWYNINYISEFILQNVTTRAIEMSSEALNYGLLNSNESSWSGMYSNNFFYIVFQYFFHPIISSNHQLYNSFLFVPLLLIFTVFIDFRKAYNSHKEILFLLTFLMITIIALNFGSNVRYKFITAFLSILLLNLSNGMFFNRKFYRLLTLFIIYNIPLSLIRF